MRLRTAQNLLMTSLLVLGAALGAGLIAGVFFAFSSFVLPALARLPAAQGVAAMQSVNVVVLNRWFLGVFLGTALLSLALGVLAWRGGLADGRGYCLVGCALYLLGVILVTRAGNVPLNDALARIDAHGVGAQTQWAHFVSEWSVWNHLRALAALAACASFILALVRARGGVLTLFGAVLLGGCAGPLRPIAPPSGGAPVERLSELGIFAGDPAKQIPRAGFVEYEVNAPLYADGATKRHFVYVPPGKRIVATGDRFVLPVGAYLVKTFGFPKDLRDPSQGEQLLETRFLIRTESGYTASTYVWNEAQSDALASPGDIDVPVAFVDASGRARREQFHVPSPSQCRACHAGRALGWRARQLDLGDQLIRFQARGLIDRLPPAHLVLVDPRGSAPLAQRARSYLDANCSHCHGEGGSAERTDLFWDLEHTTPSELPTCRDTSPIDGRDRVLVPGHPEQSEFLARMRSPNRRVHMPRGPSRIADQAGIALLDAWVAAMPARVCDD